MRGAKTVAQIREGSEYAQPASWADRWFDARNRLLSSRGFQRFSAALPFTRPIARRRGRALFDLCAGFVYSQILLACVRLRLFEILAGGAEPIGQVAERTGLSEAAARRLLKAAAALKLVEARGGDRFGLGMHGAALLGNPGLAMMIEHHALLYDDLRDPIALLRGERRETAIGGLWPYADSTRPGDLPDEKTASYTALMSATQQMVAEDVLAAYPFRRHRTLMDLGGGDGAFLSAVARRVPKLNLILFDLPSVAERAQRRFEAEGIAERAMTIGGSFLTDPLPRGADVITLVRVIHDHGDDAVRAILAAAHQALAPGGTLVIAEPMAETPQAEPIGDAYFGFYLLAMGSGQPRSAKTLKKLLGAAGFKRSRSVRTRMPFLAGVIVAQR